MAGSDTARSSKGRVALEQPLVWWFWVLVVGVYLFALGAGTLWLLARCFPATDLTAVHALQGAPAASAEGVDAEATGAAPVRAQATLRFPAIGFAGSVVRLSTEQGLVALAVLGGLLGSVFQALQSFSVFLGNRQFIASWGPWYLTRPLLGALLGALIYFVIRAGFLGTSTDSVSPYGVVAFGGMAGLFSRQATDKLQEVFETMFRTQKPVEYKDKLTRAPLAPKLERVVPEVLLVRAKAPKESVLELHGSHFDRDAKLMVGKMEVALEPGSSSERRTAKVSAEILPEQPGTVELRVVNVTPDRTESEPKMISVVDVPPSRPGSN